MVALYSTVRLINLHADSRGHVRTTLGNFRCHPSLHLNRIVEQNFTEVIFLTLCF